MEVIDQETIWDANYNTTDIETTTAQYDSYRELESLFNKHRSSIISSGIYVMPIYWAIHVAGAVKELITINEKIRFVDIKEGNSKLILNLHYPNVYDKRIHFKVYEIKNLVDRLVHLRIRRLKVARSFYHDVYPFC